MAISPPLFNLSFFTLENYKPISFIQDNYPLKLIKLFIIDYAGLVHRSMASFSLGKLPMREFLPNGREKTMMI